MEVVLARIGRPHGIRGEVSVEVRTDDPDRRLAPGTTLRTEPASVGPLTIADGRVHSGRLILRFEGYDGRGAAEGLRNVLLVADVDPAERPEDPDEYYDHQLVGLSVRTVAGEPVGELTEVLHLPGQDVLAVRRPGRHRGAGAVRGGDGARPSTSTRGVVLVDPPPGLLTDVPAESRPMTASDVRLDVVTIFPDYLAPLRLSLIGRAVDDGLIDLRVHDLRAWTHDRHRTVDDSPVRRGAGHADAAGAVGRRPRRGLGGATRRAPAPRSWCPDARRARRSPRRWRTSWRPSRGWSSPAAATRASTPGCSTRPPSTAGWTRSRSATTCSTAARWPCWSSSRRWPGCCPA